MPLSSVASQCRDRINDRINALFDTENGQIAPYVCVICDRFIEPGMIDCIRRNEIISKKQLLEPIDDDLPTHLQHCYKLTFNSTDPLHDVMLSPRASSYYVGANLYFRCCSECKFTLSALSKKPLCSISNGYAFGKTPDCLATLTDLELAFLTPVRCYGFCFTYIGGKHQNLKGTLSFYRVDTSSIARAALNLGSFAFNTNVVVLITGKKMTQKQRKRALDSSKVRIDKIMEALTWLTEHHEAYGGINLDQMKENLQQPVVINEVKDVVDDSDDAEMANIEQTETYSVYFPDGQMTTLSGGHQSIEEFKSMIATSKVDVFNVSFQCNLQKQYCKELQQNNFVDANILQFPYRTGGPHDLRLNENDTLSTVVDLEHYINHLSRLSQPAFHRPLFVLMLYSLKQKHLMLKYANFELKKPRNVTDFASNLAFQDLQSTATLRSNGYRSRGNKTSNNFLNSVTAITKALPHTNDAAKKARSKIETLQHHFGLPSLFLTVTFDDENSFFIQLYASTVIDDTTPVDTLTDSQLTARKLARHQLRIKYPGLAALYYEYLLNIVLEEVVGYDMDELQPTTHPGLFGHCVAASVSTEEQGRKTCHAHIVIWVREYIDIMHHMIHSPDKQERERLKERLCSMYDDVSTTSLLGETARPRTAFKHKCSQFRQSRKSPQLVEPQQLRNLRHVKGYSHDKNIAFCPHCSKQWSSEELVQDFLVNQENIPKLSAYPDPCNRLHAKCIEYQKNLHLFSIPEHIINSAYNHHLSHHTKTCFDKHTKFQKPKKKQKNDSALLSTGQILDEIECRMRYPSLPNPTGVLLDLVLEDMDWYKWDGEILQLPLYEVIPRRSLYDVFENISCPAISQSKCTCNTNITLLMPGPIPIYVTKYSTKKTQEEDTQEFRNVLDVMQCDLARDKSQQHDIPRSEAQRRLLRATFAHNSENVVGAPLAAWLVRQNSRFQFSHTFAWCPLGDFYRILTNQGVSTQLRYACDGTATKYFENKAMHYICRPTNLEHIPVYDFYTDYEVVNNTKFRRKEHSHEIMDFFDHNNFIHPSTTKSGTKRQALIPFPRDKPRPLLQISQWEFPILKTMHGCIFDPNTPKTPQLEKYAALILILTCPFRTGADLLYNGSYMERLRRFTIQSRHQSFLQHLQDSRTNSLDVPKVGDVLVRQTKPFKDVVDVDNRADPAENDDSDSDEDSTDEDEEPEEVPLNIIDSLIESLQDRGIPECTSENSFDSISFKQQRQKGTNRCGFMQLADVHAYKPTQEHRYVVTQDINTNHCNPKPAKETISTLDDPEFKDLIRLIYDRTTRRQTMPVTMKEGVTLMNATGSAESIMNWSHKSGIDKWQRRSFEIFAATFVLSFYKDQTQTAQTLAPNDRHAFLKEKCRLLRLSDAHRRQQDSGQLICFLHGPGGSGKTTVIDLLLTYAREFCNHLDYSFTRRTIVVTALTGVAATLLLGETIHSAIPLRTRTVSEELVEAWMSTRLLIVDEISFASPKTIRSINSILGKLKGLFGTFSKYGGIDIIFSGDLRQLEPCREPPIYDEYFPEFHDWINCYIELQGMHRFKTDRKWGEILLRIRDGTVTLEDIDYINTRVATSTTKLPKGLKYATPNNKERDAINTGLFYKYCEQYSELDTALGAKYARHALLIFSDQLQIKDSNGSFVFLNHPSTFYEGCGEDDIKFGSNQTTRRDPVLMTYPGCELMLTNNMNVPSGLANGTLAMLKQVVLKANEYPEKIQLDNGIYVDYVYASQIDFCTLHHTNVKINPPEFRLAPEMHLARVRFPLPRDLATPKKKQDFVTMKFCQMPFVRADATTGHKFQGRSVTFIFIHDWSNTHRNWAYVMLSRVRAIAGLFLRKPLPRDPEKFRPPPQYLDLISSLKQHQPIFTDEEDPFFYAWVMGDDNMTHPNINNQNTHN